MDIFCVLSRLLPHLVHRSAVFSDNARFCGTYCIPARVIKLDDTSSKMIIQRIRGDITHTFVNIERAIVLFARPLNPHSSELFVCSLMIQIEFDTNSNHKKIKFQWFKKLVLALNIWLVAAFILYFIYFLSLFIIFLYHVHSSLISLCLLSTFIHKLLAYLIPKFISMKRYEEDAWRLRPFKSTPNTRMLIAIAIAVDLPAREEVTLAVRDKSRAP